MSLCQTEGSSCGACCGLFNLDYPHSTIRKILEDRTNSFNKDVNYSRKETVISYREKFENKEHFYPKKDGTIYNCPFLGYIEPNAKKIGCMIHPVKTGDPMSQNFSFYGASICQSYDCKNKERTNSKDWENLFNSLNLSFSDYSQLAGNHILITRIEEFFVECGISLESMFLDFTQLLEKVLLFKLNDFPSHTTSFEIDMDSGSESSKFQMLVVKLGLATTERMYLELYEVYMSGKKEKPTAL